MQYNMSALFFRAATAETDKKPFWSNDNERATQDQNRGIIILNTAHKLQGMKFMPALVKSSNRKRSRAASFIFSGL
jgi:hypothetical protein